MESVILPYEVTCPHCGKKFTIQYPVYLNVEADPQGKSDVLSGMLRVVQCPHCGATGEIDLPFIYHDGEKELLIYYIPGGVTNASLREETNRFFGSITRKVMDSLPPEQRKGYFLRPKEVFSWENLEREILHADGVTDEEIERSRKQERLLLDLVAAGGDEAKIQELVEENKDLVTLDFVQLLENLVSAAREGIAEEEKGKESRKAQEAEAYTESLEAAYTWVLENTEAGKALGEEKQAFIDILSTGDFSEMARIIDRVPLEAMGNLAELMFSRFEKEDLDLFISAVARRIVKEEKTDAAGAELLREKKDAFMARLGEIEKGLRKNLQAGTKMLEEIMNAPDIRKAVEERMEEIDERFIMAWNQAMEHAALSGNTEIVDKLQRIKKTYEELTEKMVSPPVRLLYQLADASSPEEIQEALKENADQLTPEFMEILKKLSDEAETEEQRKFWGKVYAMAILMG